MLIEHFFARCYGSGSTS